MDKIFDNETVEYLKIAGVSDNEIKNIKHTKYKEGMLNIANKLLEAIEKEDYSIIKPFTAYSPAGDCMGIDNTIISFASINGFDKDKAIYSTDIKEAFNILKSFK